MPDWTDVNPHGGVSYDLTGDGRTAVKVSMGRFNELTRSRLTREFHPFNSSVSTANRLWIDANQNWIVDCDTANLTPNGECGAVSNANYGQFPDLQPEDYIFGNLEGCSEACPATMFDPNVLYDNRPYTWDFLAKIQRELLTRTVGQRRLQPELVRRLLGVGQPADRPRGLRRVLHVDAGERPAVRRGTWSFARSVALRLLRHPARALRPEQAARDHRRQVRQPEPYLERLRLLGRRASAERHPRDRRSRSGDADNRPLLHRASPWTSRTSRGTCSTICRRAGRTVPTRIHGATWRISGCTATSRCRLISPELDLQEHAGHAHQRHRRTSPTPTSTVGRTATATAIRQAREPGLPAAPPGRSRSRRRTRRGGDCRVARASGEGPARGRASPGGAGRPWPGGGQNVGGNRRRRRHRPGHDGARSQGRGLHAVIRTPAGRPCDTAVRRSDPARE